MEFRYLARTQATEEVLRNFESGYSIADVIRYTPPHLGYEERRLEDLQDSKNLIPLKRTEFDSHLMQMGAYGWTILNHNIMRLDRYLPPGKHDKTDYHELIHTENEHETRQLTEWAFAVVRAPNYYS